MKQLKKELKFSIIGAIITPILFLVVMFLNKYDNLAVIAGYVLFFGFFEYVFLIAIKIRKDYIRI